MDSIDFLAVSPHPDDAELFCGGLLARAKRQGATTSIVDLSAGELSTRGEADQRRIETTQASAILNLDYRINLGIPDGNMADSPENRLKLIEVIRKLRPGVCLLPYGRDRHPDHEAAAVLSRRAVYQAGLKKLNDGREAYRPSTVLYYMLHHVFDPSFVVDISTAMETKMEAIQAYRSQFLNKEQGENTFISRPAFLESIITRARFYGYQINCLYGEPYFFDGTLKIDNVKDFFAYTKVL